MKILAPSILSADFSNLSQQIRMTELGGADWIHCDIMDGHFVPNISYGSIGVKAVKNSTSLPIDVHLMIENPDFFIEDFVNSGADYITVHQEAVIHLHRTIQKIKSFNTKCGVALNPSTPLNTLNELFEEIDLLLIMSVNPGFGGQKFIKKSLNKIEAAANIKEKNNLKFLIEVDGGIDSNTIKSASDAGCNVFVAGSSIFNSGNITASTTLLKNILKKG